MNGVCVACGMPEHGSVTLGMRCLEGEVERLRGVLAAVGSVGARVLAAKAAADALPCTPGGSVDEQRRAGRK